MVRNVLFICMIFCLGGFAYADSAFELIENRGHDESPAGPVATASWTRSAPLADNFLMVPDSTTDTVGMYDVNDGTYLGDIINGAGLFSTPINAVLGPDGDIYVSDQGADGVFVFDIDGNYLYTYADATDGLDNVRGIDFRDGHLFVCTYYGFIAEFDGPHSRLPDFIVGPGGYWDIHFLPDGTCLVNDSNSDTCTHHDTDGSVIATLLNPDFPEQVQRDTVLPGEYLCAVFSDLNITDFEIDGTVVETTPTSASTRGVYRLGNGNLLVAQSDGVWEVEPGSGVYVGQEFAGSSRFIELVGDIVTPALTVNPKTISAYFGGMFTFELFGDGLGGRDYILLGSATGISPPMILPGGGILFLAKDWFTMLVLKAALAGGLGVLDNFLGTLDVDGYATATMTLPGHCQLFDDLDLWFAWTTYNPFDFQSNTVTCTVTGAPPEIEEYYWDDGTSENALGWNAGGTACWIHSFDSGAGDTIEQVCSCFGQAGSANGPANGTAIDIWVWSDPNQDGEPSDGLVLGHGSGVVANTSTNDFNHYDVDVAAGVTGLFFVGCSLEQAVGVFAAPMDQNTLGLGVSFFAGAFTGGPYGPWDPYNLSTHPIYAMGAIGFDSVWMLRANDP